MALTISLKWSFLSELASKAIQPIAFVLLARILVPEDFGIVAAAMMVIAFSQVFWEAGVGKAIIQTKERINEAASAGFWINITLGIFVAAMLYLAAPKLGSVIIKDDRAIDVIRVMVVLVLLGSVGSIHTSLLQRNFDFKSLFWIRLVSVSLPGLASIPLAMVGYGYWAIVAGTLIGQFFQLILLWTFSTWRPSLRFDLEVAGKIIKFGFWVTLSGLLLWFYAWMDVFVVGYFLGTGELGIFRTGNQFIIMIFGLAFAPLLPVLYSHFSKLQDQLSVLREQAILTLSVLRVLSIPIATFMFFFSNEISQLIFGSNWLGIEHVVAYMALAHGVSWLTGINNEFYRAMGRPNLELVVNLSLVLVYFFGYVASVTHGLETFLAVRVVLAFIAFIFHLVVLRYVLSVTFLNSLLRAVFLMVINILIMVAGIQLLKLSFGEVPTLSAIIFGVLVMCAAVMVNIYIEKDSLKSLPLERFRKI